MKKLSKKQRHEIYKKALGYHLNLEKERWFFLCDLLAWKANIEHYQCKTHLQEFWLFNPEEDYSGAWYSSCFGFPQYYNDNKIKKHQRIVLQFCIEMTK